MTAENTSSDDLVLIIDDEPNNIDILRLDLEDDYRIITATNGQEGWDLLLEHTEEVSVILLDRMMPVMNGMEFMSKLKGEPKTKNIPVVMQTAAAEKSQVVEGIDAGVYYYLTKPYEVDVMRSVIRAAIQSHNYYQELQNELGEHRKKLFLVRESIFELKTLDEARYLATFISNFFPDPDRVIMGICELLINAIEHGNLGITYDEKSDLNNNNCWETTVRERQAKPEYCDRKAVAHFKREDDQVSLKITDEGDGFDWERYMQLDPDRATDNHGRGIAMSNMISFDEIQYLGKGNEVMCTVKLGSDGTY